MSDFTGMPVQARALPYVDKSVSERPPGRRRAASVMTANADRLAISIMPNANGRLYYRGGGGRWALLPLYAGVARTLTGAECPAGDLYVTGQPRLSLRIGEA
jgi:hypothetical protein